VLVLMHGTFSPDAEWTLPGSSLRSALEHEFNDELTITRFSWSGINSHAERILAAEKFGRFVREWCSSKEKTRLLVIAHSHGANVVRYALRDPFVARKVPAVLAIAAPFIEVGVRDLAESLDDSFDLLLPASFGVIAFGLRWFWIDVLHNPVEDFSPSDAFCATAGGLMFILNSRTGSRLKSKAEARFIRRLQHLQRRTASSVAPPYLGSTSFTHIIDVKDEVLSFLSHVWKLAEAPFRIVSRYKRIAGVVLYGLALASFYAAHNDARAWSQRFVEAGLILCASIFVGSLALIVFPKLFRVWKLGFGPESIAQNLLCRIEVTAAPDSIRNFHLIVVRQPSIFAFLRKRLRGRISGGLAEGARHCAIYSTQEGQSAILHWARMNLLRIKIERVNEDS
jgi:hypothetical protein